MVFELTANNSEVIFSIINCCLGVHRFNWNKGISGFAIWFIGILFSVIGAVFTVPTVACTSEECIRFLQERKIQILTAQLQDSHLYYDTDMRKGTAIVMGTESTGLTARWREAATAHIRIPMLGQLDSLNVSVSAAILLFEAVRQRNEN